MQQNMFNRSFTERVYIRFSITHLNLHVMISDVYIPCLLNQVENYTANKYE